MAYYKELRKMYITLENLLKSNNTLDIADLIYTLTTQFEVSEKAILKRIDLLNDTGRIEKSNLTIKWKQKTL